MLPAATWPMVDDTCNLPHTPFSFAPNRRYNDTVQTLLSHFFISLTSTVDGSSSVSTACFSTIPTPTRLTELHPDDARLFPSFFSVLFPYFCYSTLPFSCISARNRLKTDSTESTKTMMAKTTTTMTIMIDLEAAT